MEAINVRHLESEIFSQVFFAACHSSSEFLGLAARTPFFTSIQKRFIGLRSGDCAGHSKTLILWDRNQTNQTNRLWTEGRILLNLQKRINI